MVKINILKFLGCTEAQWLQWLKSKKCTAFLLVLPRRAIMHRDKNYGVLQYLMAACAGQELGYIADALFYNTPPPAKKGAFHFLIATRRLPVLAAVLTEITNRFTASGEPAPGCIEYLELFHKCMKYWTAKGLEQYACPGLAGSCSQLEAGIRKSYKTKNKTA